MSMAAEKIIFSPEIEAGFATAIRDIRAAKPERRLADFAELCGWAYKKANRGLAEKADIGDRLAEVAVATRLEVSAAQQARADAAVSHYLEVTDATHLDIAYRKKKSATLVISRASDIKPVPISWLWPGRIAIGKQTIVAGEPGLGKSQLTCAVASAVTTGGRWPGDEGKAPPGSVIILSAEDDAADTIRPRLDAAGADVTRIHIATAVKAEDGKGRRSFSLQADLLLLETEIQRIGDVKLIIVDPVSSYLGKVDSHKNAELRAVLEPIGEMASRLGVAVLSVTHLSKGGGNGANSRIIGSIAFVAAARAAFVVCRDPNDGERRLFLPTKNNVGPEGTGLGFRVGAQVTPSGIVAPAIFWDTLPVTMTADEVLSATSTLPSRESPARNAAEEFLRDLLSRGALPVAEVQSEAKAAGMAWATVRRAKDTMHLVASKSGLGGGWQWSMPAEDAHRRY